MLVFVLIAAVFCAWLKMRLASQQAAVVERIRKQGGTVYYDHQRVRHPLGLSSQLFLDSHCEPSGNEFLRKVLGNDYFDTVIAVHFGSEVHFDARGTCCVRECDTQMTDSQLSCLTGLENLQEVVVVGSQLTDKGIAQLAQFKHLRSVRIDSTNATDAGVQNLQWALPACEIIFHRY